MHAPRRARRGLGACGYSLGRAGGSCAAREVAIRFSGGKVEALDEVHESERATTRTLICVLEPTSVKLFVRLQHVFIFLGGFFFLIFFFVWFF